MMAALEHDQRHHQAHDDEQERQAGSQITPEAIHMKTFPECDQFSGRKRQICRGEVLTLEKCQQYRQMWGLQQNPLLLPTAQVIQSTLVPAVTGGPGTELKQLLRMLGIPSDWCESCTQRAATMDRWGVAGCIVHRAEIRRWLVEQQAAASRSTKRSAAWQALRNGSAWQIIRSGDPVEWMIVEALTRAAEIVRKRSRPAPVTVVIPCHNYARYLGDALLSLRASTVQAAEIVVIDDASDDDPAAVCRRHEVRCERVEFRDVHQVRRHGLQSVRTKYVLFLDADNVVPAAYLETAVEQLEADRDAAFVFPVLQAFGEKSGAMYGTGQAPAVIHASDIEPRNLCDANSVCRTEALRSTRAFEGPPPQSRRTQDWRVFRQVLRQGPWHALKSPVPLHYRVHAAQASRTIRATYYQDADLANETVSILIPFSGRWDAWEKLRDWLQQQTWPRTRLVILNSTHQPLTLSRLGLADWHGDLAISRIDAGRPRLADEDRRGRRATVAEVEAAVTGLYNRGLLLCQDEYVLTLEDDVIPQRPDAIERLMQQMGPRVAAVSGVYRHRYKQRQACAFRVPWGTAPMLPLDGPEIERVGGTGFGCLLLRRSVLSRYALSGDDARRPHYDVDIGSRLVSDGWEWILDRGVRCDHLISG